MSRHRSMALGERGSALVATLAALFLLTLAGLILLKVSQGEVQMNSADLRSKQAFYLAEAGIEQGREVLRAYRTSHSTISVVGLLKDIDGPNATINANPDVITVTFGAPGAAPTLGGFGDDTAVVAMTPYGNGWFATFLTNDVREDPGGRANSATDSNKRVMLIGVGATADRAVEIAEAVVDTGPDMPTPPATITVLGDKPKFDAGTSASMFYTGDDCYDPGANKGAGAYIAPHLSESFDVVGVTTPTSLATVQADINSLTGSKPKQYVFQTHDDTGALVTGAATAADITSNPFYMKYPAFSDCNAMLQLGQQVAALADVKVADGTKLEDDDVGTATNPRIVYCEGDCELTAKVGAGYGVLWVNGKLDIAGGVMWYGQIYVVGKGEVERMGTGNDGVFGSVVIANTAEGKCNGASPGGFGQGADFNTRGGGTSVTGYCSYYNNLAWAASPVSLRSFRQQ